MRTASVAALSVALLAVSPLSSLADAADWKIDPAHTRVGFSVSHMMFSDVEGRFHGITGEVRIDEKAPTKSTVSIVIDAATIDTDNDRRDEHLRSPDFLDVEKHPKITFQSTQITKAGKHYKVTGNLTIRGTTKPVTLDVQFSKPVKDPWGKMVRAVKVDGELARSAFGLTWNKALETGGVLVGEKVTIDIRMELNQ